MTSQSEAERDKAVVDAFYQAPWPSEHRLDRPPHRADLSSL
jgi:hypothetical protein